MSFYSDHGLFNTCSPSQDELYQVPYILGIHVEDDENELNNDNVSNVSCPSGWNVF